MILRSEVVEQTIDGERKAVFLKEVLLAPGAQAIAMVRKRLPPPAQTRGVVVLVHGFGQNRYAWHVGGRSFVNYLAAAGWDVFNIDLRGHGRSLRMGAKRPQVFDEYIREDVPACALRALEISEHDKVFLVGHSMGGLISYSAAATSLRDVVRGVVSLASPYRFGLGSRMLNALSMLVTAMRFTGAFDSNPVVPLRFIGRELRKRRVFWDNRVIPLPFRVWVPGSVEKEVLDEYLHRAFDPTSAAVALAILQAGQEAALKSHDGQVNYGMAFEWLDKPLLVIAGTEDHLAPPSSVRPAYDRSHSRDKTYRAFPLGHIDIVVGREAPKTVWPLIERWMSRR